MSKDSYQSDELAINQACHFLSLSPELYIRIFGRALKAAREGECVLLQLLGDWGRPTKIADGIRGEVMCVNPDALPNVERHPPICLVFATNKRQVGRTEKLVCGSLLKEWISSELLEIYDILPDANSLLT